MHPPSSARVETLVLAATLLFENGQTTERVVGAVERLGRALGLSVTLHVHWSDLSIQLDGTPYLTTVRAMPLGVDMAKVLATMTIVDRACDGAISSAQVSGALAAVKHLPPVSSLLFALSAAIGAASLGVIFDALDAPSLLLIALSAALGAFLRRGLAKLGAHPFVPPLCAAALAGLVGAAATRFGLSGSQGLVALCPCMVLIPGPHILNGGIDFARIRITLGIARLTYAGLILLMICIGLLLGLSGAHLPSTTVSGSAPLAADVVAAGFAVAAFGTFFAIPWRLLFFPIAIGMLAHGVRWALISLAGADVPTGALVASLLVGTMVTPVADRLHLPFAALSFSAVVSMMPGIFLFRAAGSLATLVSMGDRAPPALLASIVANGATAFLVVVAMTVGLILPRMLLEHFVPSLAGTTPKTD